MQLVHDISVSCARGTHKVPSQQDAPPGHNGVLVPVPHLDPHGLQAPFPMSWPTCFERSSSIVNCIVRYGAYAQVANPRGFTRRSRVTFGAEARLQLPHSPRFSQVRHPKSKTASAVFPDFQPSIFEFSDRGFCVGLVLSRRIHITNPLSFLGPKW